MDREELVKILEEFTEANYPSHEVIMYADYRDELSDTQALKILESDHPWEEFNDILWDAYLDSESYYLHDIEEEFNRWCSQAGYDCTSEDLDDADIYITDFIGIYPDSDHFLDQEFKCRLIVDNGDGNYDFSRNPNQDNDYTIEDGAGIIWLGEKLGYSIDQMQEALNAGINVEAYPIDETKNPDPFLDSLVHEAANAYGMIALTFLCRMSLRDLIKYKEDHTSVTVDLNGINCGFYDAWNGSGSVLELECGIKSITIPYDMIHTLVPDVRCWGQYSVDEVYGLSGNCYAEAKAD